jgi:hypothetical protein
MNMSHLVINVFIWLASLWFCGWLGNFCTTLFFRVPRAIPLNGQDFPPMCSNCSVRIRWPDYAPFFYYPIKPRTCRSCNAIVPKVYLVLEVCIAALALLTLVLNGFNEVSLVKCLIVAILSTIVFINIYHNRVYEKTLWMLAILLVIYHALLGNFTLFGVLTDKLIYGIFLAGGLSQILRYIKNPMEVTTLTYLAVLSLAIPGDIVFLAMFYVVIIPCMVFLHVKRKPRIATAPTIAAIVLTIAPLSIW